MYSGRHYRAGGVGHPLNRSVRTLLAKHGWYEIASNRRRAGGGPRVEFMVVTICVLAEHVHFIC